MIKVENLSRKYGNFLAVDNVSFDIGQGEIVGLLGHNGAGKTTILKMLTGFLEPSSGKVKIDGMDIMEQRKKIQKTIGYLPENCPVYPEMTVIDYLDYAAALHDVDQMKRERLIAEVISQTDLTEKATQTISTLSRGYRQRLGVAQAILHKPRILILDEPTNGLDPTQIQHMRELITDLAKQATVIISTHILQEVQAVSDRVIIINNGCKVVDSRLNELQIEPYLLLKTDAPPESVNKIVHSIKGLIDINEKPNRHSEAGHCYKISLGADTDKHMSAASLAQNIIAEDWQIYALHPETRDLETVFAEASARVGG